MSLSKLFFMTSGCPNQSEASERIEARARQLIAVSRFNSSSSKTMLMRSKQQTKFNNIPL